jgi:hypothetical protein
MSTLSLLNLLYLTCLTWTSHLLFTIPIRPNLTILPLTLNPHTLDSIPKILFCTIVLTLRKNNVHCNNAYIVVI